MRKFAKRGCVEQPLAAGPAAAPPRRPSAPRPLCCAKRSSGGPGSTSPAATRWLFDRAVKRHVCSALGFALSALAILSPIAADQQPTHASQAQEAVAGTIFGVPVSVSNYSFAKRVASLFPYPWEEGLSPEDRERAIWEALILHYESFRRGVTVTDQMLEDRINAVLKGQQQPFTKAQDPAAYATWVKDTLQEDVELFENQMRYLLQIEQLKAQVRASLPVTITEEEMQEEFLNEQHHLGGEMVVFDTQQEAQAFYEQVKDPAAWERMRGEGHHHVRPVSLMTLEAYMDLWSIPKPQLYAFHAQAIGSVGPPMPFGKSWCVYRLLDKRTGDLKDFPQQRAAYEAQLRTKKQYGALKRWIEDLKTSATLHLVPQTR